MAARLPAPLPPVAARRQAQGQVEIVLIGTSTGGPQALKVVIPRLPADFPVPVAMVLHMPIGYTETYAQKLNEMSSLTVVEAKGNEEVRPGLVFLAPAGRHLTFRRDDDGIVRTALALRPLDTPHRPSVDVLFRSAAEVFGAGCAGRGDDRDGGRWARGSGLDQGERRPDHHRGRGDLRGLRNAALGRRGRAQRRGHCD